MVTATWRTALRLPWSDRFLFVEALALLALARVMVLLLPFRVLTSRLGVARLETEYDDDPRARAILPRMRWALLAASRRAPWRCKCLEQAIAGKRMLRLRRIRSTIYLGVAHGANGVESKLGAHAWLRCGSFFVAGGDGGQRFAVVSAFGDR